jgi:DNA-binding transcriptional regulator YbjK
MHTDSSIEKRRRVKSCANEAVLGMQKFETFKGVALPDLMAELCQKYTASSQQEAQERALRDASYVDLCR